MQLAPAQLASHLARGLRSLYVLHGDEPLLQQESADALRKAAREQGYTERSVFTVAGPHFDWGAVLVACGSMSLFAERQLIELRIPSGKPGKEGGAALVGLVQALQDQEAVLGLITLPRLDRQTRASAWFSALEASAVCLQIDAVDRAALPQWIAQRLAGQGQRVASGVQGQQALAFFADRVEGNLLAAHQEIQKLGLLYPPGELSLEQVESAVLNVARYDVFKLSEAVLAGQAQRVQRMIEGLRAEGESEVLVHWALAEDIRSLKRVKEAIGQGRPLPLALRENRIWGLKERLFERVLPQLTISTLVGLLEAAHKVDGIVKGLRQPDWPADGWQALHRLALQLCQHCVAGTRAARGEPSLQAASAASISPRRDSGLSTEP
ncbi:MAG: DNA polymerase III subunit delta [Betaproteobacteria bacterium]